MAANIDISIEKQELQLVQDGQCHFRAPISSGAAGTGSEENSGKTPLGRFTIASKHGENAPSNCIFRARLPLGLYPRHTEDKAQEYIIARILTLDGQEAHNRNTKARYIYIHGTTDEQNLGRPASLGCIRLSAADMIELYELCPLGTEVHIH